MSPEITVLTLTAAAIAFMHTLLGPDHYLPFVAMAKARAWSMSRTLRITLLCGVGHLLGSVVLGLVGIFLGIQVASLEWLEGVRGELAAWLLIGFGLAYMAWGLRQAWRNRPHVHWHQHDGFMHRHVHTHRADHAHVHDVRENGSQAGGGRSVAPWFIFIVFVLGPCEPLIPLLMVPAASESLGGVLLVTGVFGLVTVATMLLTVAVSLKGLERLKWPRLQRYAHALAGGTITACGLAVVLLGI